MSAVEASAGFVARPKDETPLAPRPWCHVVEGLCMRYGATEAIAGIDLRVARERSSPSSAPTDDGNVITGQAELSRDDGASWSTTSRSPTAGWADMPTPTERS